MVPTQPIERLETGIGGLDSILHGGLRRGRSTLVAGTSGSAKTVFAGHFIAEGIARGETGVFVTFEETPEDLRRNMLGFGWDIQAWEAEKKWLFVDASPRGKERSIVAGEYDFGALLARVEHAGDSAFCRVPLALAACLAACPCPCRYPSFVASL